MDNTKQQFETVYANTNEKIKLFLIKNCRNITDVNDIFQETYLEFYEVLERKGFSYVKNPEALLHRIARKRLHKYYKRWDKGPERMDYMEPEEKENLPDYSNMEVEEAYIRQELITEVKEALLRRPGDIQKIFYLHFTMDKSFVEIAELLSMKESTVKSRLYRTMKEMRRQFEVEETHERKRII